MTRIRVRREILTSGGSIQPGEVVTIDDATAREWVARGDAFEEKSYRPPNRPPKRKHVRTRPREA